MKKIISALTIAAMLAANIMSVNCFAADEWIYYSNSKDIHRPYRIKDDGTEMTRLSLETAYDLTPFGDHIYYQNNSDMGGILRTKKDSLETEVIAGGIRNTFRGMAHNSSNVFILYETNYNVGNCEYAGPVLTLCIYDKKGECTEKTICNDDFAEIVGADENYLYFSVKDGDDRSYQKMKLTSSNDIQFIDCKETELPESTDTSLDIHEIPCSDHFRNKYLSWKGVDDATAYRIFKRNTFDKKYKQIAETTDTHIDLCVKASEYGDEYKVLAVKDKNGVRKQYKVTMLSSEHTFGNTEGNLTNSPFSAAYGDHEYYSEGNCIYKINTKNGKKKLLWNGKDRIVNDSARYLNVYEDKLFFFGRYSNLCCIDTDGNNIDIMSDFCSSIGIAPEDLSDRDFDIHSIAVCNGLLYVSYHLEKGSNYDHTVAFDINTGTLHMINDFPISQIGFSENKIVFISDNDGLIYSTSLDSKETVCISEETALSLYIDNENNKLYFCNEKGIFMSETDGTNCKRIYGSNVKAVNSDGQRLYFIRDDLYRKNYVWNSKLTAWSIEFGGTSPKMITDVSGDGGFMSLNILGDNIYVLFSTEDVYSYSIKK